LFDDRDRRRFSLFVWVQFVLFLLFSSCVPLSAQDSIPTAITPTNNSGDLPYSTSIGTEVEHIDLSSGNLIVDIPFISVPGRKMNFDFGVRYDARFWVDTTLNNQSAWNPEQRNWLTANTIGWTPSQGYLTYTYGPASCVITGGEINPGSGSGTTYASGQRGDNYIFTDRHGVKHSFLVNLSLPGECSRSDGAGYDFDSSNYVGPSPAMDGWYASFSTPTPNPYIVGPDGTSYFGGGTSGGTSQLPAGNYFTDRAGESDLRGNSQIVAANGTDSVGRTPVSQQINGNQIIYSINDSNGNLQTYTINLVAVQIATAFGSSATEYNQQRQTVSSIVLPNKQSYGFLYDSWGNITQLTLPTGATISYSWDTVTVGSSGNLVRAVTKRTVQHDGVSDVWNISFAPPTASGQTVTVTDPADSNGVSRQEIYTYDLTQHLSQIQYLSSAGGQPLLQYDLTWDGLTSWTGENNLLTSIKTTLENSQVSLRTFEYDLYGYTHQQWNCVGEWATCAAMANGGTLNGVPFVPAPPTYLPPPTWFPGSHGNVTRIQEYDWGQGAPGPLVRQTIRTYLHDDPNSGYFIATPNATKPGATLRNIANRVTSETIYDGSVSCEGTGTWTDDGNGTITPAPQCKANQLAKTTVVYDNGDPATYGYYGEPTSVSRWVNGPGGGSAITSYIYNGNGNVTSVTDPRGGTTQYIYGDASVGSSTCPGTSGSNAYVVTKTNALQQQEGFSYYQCTGKIASHKDANDIASARPGTQYGYDLMGRSSSVSYPDGGQTTTTYNDALRTVDVKQLIASGETREVITQLDNLGRSIQSQLLPDPQGTYYTETTYTDTVYDALGRVASVSNPYRSKSDATYGITSYSYDVLGRKLLQCQPDNGNNTPCAAGSSYLQWLYPGNTITSYDELRNSWQHSSDALGRLTDVVEPGNLKTHYSYDALGNLWSVTQYGAGDTPRTRSFVYDSLSRLTSSTNPETGVIGYGYLFNGVLCSGDVALPCSKTDARGITTNYSYDALNRLMSKQYSGEADPTHPTLSTCYLYDADANSGSNAIGRLVSEWTQSGNCATSATGVPNFAVSWKNSLSYDPMGRVTNEVQCAFGPCSTPSPLQYVYDLAGNLTYATNGLSGPIGSQSPQVSWTNSYDSAGRLSKVVSSWSAAHPATLFQADASVASALGVPGAAYSPFGGLTAAQYGIDGSNNVGLSETRSYDSRSRLLTKTVLGSALTPNSAGTLQITPNPVAQGDTVFFSNACGDICGTGDGLLYIDGAIAHGSGFSYTPSSGPFNWNEPSTNLLIGQHSAYVQYSGDATHPSLQTNTAYFTVQANQQPTASLAVTINPSAIPSGEEATATVQTTCGKAGCYGLIEFSIVGTGWAWSATPDDIGSASVTLPNNLDVGSYTLDVHYDGDTGFSYADSMVPFTVVENTLPQPNINATLDPNPIPSGEYSTLTVTSSCNYACGGANILIDGSYNNGLVFDSTGSAQIFLNTTQLSVGQHNLQIQYFGDTSNAPTTPNFPFQVVDNNLPVPIITVSVPQQTIPAGLLGTVTVSASCGTNCGSPAKGNLYANGNYAGGFFLDSTGNATVTTGTTTLSPGQYQLTAQFFGNGSWNNAMSAPIPLTVQ
jgi:YD repeat-containing protein